MSKNDIWYGYLKAGEKSSPVVRDMSLETKSRGTIYLYNHKRGAILEYSREIVEPKLRELKPEDIPLDELMSAFRAARKPFLAGRTIKKWEKETPAISTSVSSEPDELDDDIPIDLIEEFEKDEMEV
jgi:hypothetical protein